MKTMGSVTVLLLAAAGLASLAMVHSHGAEEVGPCSSTSTTLPFSLPTSTGCGWRCSGVLYLHTPGTGAQRCPYLAPYPLVVFISGFLASAADYFEYSSHLASWGFAVLAYDFNLLAGLAAPSSFLHSDEAEVGFLPHFQSLLEVHVADPASPLHGKVDLDNLAAAGHSRGAKIAALHFAGYTPGMRAAFLIDPVDGTTATASQPGYPSAVEALRGQGKQLGIAAAGRIGPCNGAPYATGNWSQFWEVSAAGSWLEVVPDAGHLQFADISSLLDLVCCRGCQGLIGHQEGIHLAKVPMAAWFEQQLRSHTAPSDSGAGSSAARQSEGGHISTSRKLAQTATKSTSSSWKDSGSNGKEGADTVLAAVSLRAGGFREWVCAEEAAGMITFSVKGAGDLCLHRHL